MQNIYQNLGINTCPDGSVSLQKRLEAIKLLGFVSSEHIVFDSYCEAGDRSNVVPASATGFGMDIRLSPVPDTLGHYQCQYGYQSNNRFYTGGEYSPPEIESAFADAKTKIDLVKSKLPPGSVETTENDTRFELIKWEGWRFEGKKCDLLYVSFADGSKFWCPRMK